MGSDLRRCMGTDRSPPYVIAMRWNIEEYQRTVFEQLRLPISGTERVLDLGCGEGRDAAWFAQRGCMTVGVDFQAHPLWQKLARPGLEFICGNAEGLEVPDRSFDLVFMKDVLHHASSPDRVLREAMRLCVPGGQICIVEANRLNPIFYLHMTLLLGHQHFRRPLFQRIVSGVFPQARFLHFEAHVYPFRSRILIAITRALQAVIARLPLVERLASYNAALVRV